MIFFVCTQTCGFSERKTVFSAPTPRIRSLIPLLFGNHGEKDQVLRSLVPVEIKLCNSLCVESYSSATKASPVDKA